MGSDGAETRWLPVWALPNVQIGEPIETTFVAMVNCRDERVQAAGRANSDVVQFLGAFNDEFGAKVWPTVLLIREDTPERMRTATALASFRDAVCISSIVWGHAKHLIRERPGGLRFSDAFDVYPWTLGKNPDGRVYTETPQIKGLHDLNLLHAQPAPAIDTKFIGYHAIDDVLLRAILKQWRDLHELGNDRIKHRRLFRALDMARAAARMPSGMDVTLFDAGRSIALWVSAFEILAHDGRRSDFARVLDLLHSANWQLPELQKLDRAPIKKHHRDSTPHTNAAGLLYENLYNVRNDFLHGNDVSIDTLQVPNSKRNFHYFSSPLFRIALTAYLDIRFAAPMPDRESSSEKFASYIAHQMEFIRPQRLAEAAVLIADTKPQP